VTLAAVHGAVLVSAFLIFWFLAFFSLLSVGLGEVDPETGAPANPRLLWKAGIATAVAALLWAIFYGLIAFKILDL